MKTCCLIWIALFLLGCASAQKIPDIPTQKVHIEGDTFASEQTPKLTLTLDPKLKYLGSFPFDIEGIAGGYRYVWGEVDHGKHLRRTFMIQMEGYYPANHGSYSYGTPNPVTLGKHEYEHGLYVYDNDEDIRQSPGKESERTKKFMDQHGYQWDSQLVMSRFARIVEESKKNEIIFFYFENLKDYTQKSPAALTDSDPEKARIKKAADDNSRKAFSD